MKEKNIDTQGCEFYTQNLNGKKCSDWRLSDDCDKNDCYYKQLHKAEREKKSFTDLMEG